MAWHDEDLFHYSTGIVFFTVYNLLMSPAKVGVIGCGIAGPVLAIFLKLKGYEPVVYERYESTADAGLVIGYVSICSLKSYFSNNYTI